MYNITYYYRYILHQYNLYNDNIMFDRKISLPWKFLHQHNVNTIIFFMDKILWAYMDNHKETIIANLADNDLIDEDLKLSQIFSKGFESYLSGIIKCVRINNVKIIHLWRARPVPKINKSAVPHNKWGKVDFARISFINSQSSRCELIKELSKVNIFCNVKDAFMSEYSYFVSVIDPEPLNWAKRSPFAIYAGKNINHIKNENIDSIITSFDINKFEVCCR